MGEFYLGNVRLVNADGIREAVWIRVVGGVIQEIGLGEVPPAVQTQSTAVEYIDGLGQWLLPGFIDIHIHGGDGAEVMDGTVRALQTIAQFHAAHGTTGWLPTTLTAPIDRIAKAVRAVDAFRKDASTGAKALGVHLEGPFLSIKRIGAQNPAFVAEPSIASFQQMTGGVEDIIRKMTIAPEVPGALEVIEWMQRRGIIPSLGHTDATLAEANAAIALGHCHATHLFNGMRGLHHREAGVLGAALLSDDVTVELIVDLIHLEPEIVQLVLKMKGAERVCLITDAMAAAGRPDGHYTLGDLDVTVENGKAFLTEGHNIAGSTLTMDVAVRNMMQKVGVTLPDAVRMASTNPARELGLADKKGSIAVGMDADLVLLDESFSVVRTWVEGRPVYQR
jgi:N-acetylglucosamine-6-phosphate deacetylase